VPEGGAVDKECVKLFRGVSKRVRAELRQKFALREGGGVEGVKRDFYHKIHVVRLYLLGKQTAVQPKFALDLERPQLIDQP
jgi:hypothetical protein